MKPKIKQTEFKALITFIVILLVLAVLAGKEQGTL